MNDREKEIAYIAASVAAGCVPCLSHHQREAQEAGLTQNELLMISKYAFIVRRKAEEFNIGKLDTVLTGTDIESTQQEKSSKQAEESNACC